jgi:hypothetical protein
MEADDILGYDKLIPPRGRCQMCGRTVERHGVRLALDQKIPPEWGGRCDNGNLWLICDDCSVGKAENFQDDESALRWIGNVFAGDIIRAGDSPPRDRITRP